MEKEKIIIEVPSKVLRVEHAQCPRGHSLMDPAVPINGHPSIKVVIQYGAIRGNIHLDPVYGSFHNLFDVDIPESEYKSLRTIDDLTSYIDTHR